MRRFSLLLVVVPVLALLWLVAPALSRGPWTPRAEDFESGVPGVAAAASVGSPARALTLGAVRAPGRFDLVGFKWTGGGAVRLSVRVRRDGGRWTRWAALAADATGVSDPAWAGGADEYQLRVSRPLRGLRAHFVNVTGTRTGLDRARSAARRAARTAFVSLLPGLARAASMPRANGRPAVVPRSGWDPNHQCDPTHAPTYGRVDLAFVHHTVNLNSYSPSQSAGIVLAICRFHEKSNGWWDIGYNALVDRYGTIFEGRAGGLDNAVVGAQAQGFNSVSTGISNIGTFDATGQTAAGLRALGKIVGYELTLHGVPIHGSVVETSGGGPENRFAAGARVRLQRVSGHRDGGKTDCPGNALYAQLGRIRDLAASAAGQVTPRATLTASARPAISTYGRTVTFSGRLALPSGTPGGSVVVEQAQGKGWALLGQAPVSSSGAWSLRSAPPTTARVRARWASGSTSVTSAPVSLVVRPVLALSARRAGARGVLSGSVRPGRRVVDILSYLVSGGRSVFVRRRHVTVRSGRFGVTVPLAPRTTYRFVAAVAGNGTTASGRSRTVALRRP